MVYQRSWFTLFIFSIPRCSILGSVTLPAPSLILCCGLEVCLDKTEWWRDWWGTDFEKGFSLSVYLLCSHNPSGLFVIRISLSLWCVPDHHFPQTFVTYYVGVFIRIQNLAWLSRELERALMPLETRDVRNMWMWREKLVCCFFCFPIKWLCQHQETRNIYSSFNFFSLQGNFSV